MYPFGGILNGPLVAGYLASILSRFWKRRGRRPGWLVGILAIVGAIVVSWIFVFQLDLFRPWRWTNMDGKVDFLPLLVISAVPAAIASILPAAFVVELYQKRYDKARVPS